MSAFENIGPGLRRLRKARDLTQSDVATRMGIGHSQVSRIERDGANPSVRSVGRYLDAIEVSVLELVLELEEPGEELLGKLARKLLTQLSD